MTYKRLTCDFLSGTGNSYLAARWLAEAAALAAFGVRVVLRGAVWELVGVLLTFLALPLLYYVFWGLQRLKLFRILFTYTTLTKLYPRRYRAPGTTSKEMTRRFMPGRDA